MGKKGLDRYGNPLPPRPLHPDDEEKVLTLPGFEHLLGAPVVPTSAGRAELHDSLRPQKARKEKPRPIEYQFWAQVRVGDQVEVDGLHRGEVTVSDVTTRKVGGNTFVENYAIVRLATTGEELRVEDQTRMRRVQEGA